MSQFQLKNVRIKVINPTVNVSEKFSKREFVVTDNSNGNYPQDILFQSTQDKCALLDNFKINDSVDVSFNIRGREWKSPQGELKYFTSLEAWRIDRTNTGDVGAPSPSEFGIPTAGSDSTNNPNPLESQSDETDDLPF
ncbi:MAG: DUF3127 domain-containing protein [Flavobacteriia bacterium]|nr:DUF3127 domain-containing protein [Flavobacteriia bacterium]